MSSSIQQWPWHTEHKVLEAQKEVLEHNSQIPKKFKEVLSWIPRGPVQHQELTLLYEKISHVGAASVSKNLPKETLSIGLALVDKMISYPTKSPVSPLVSALNLDYPLCPTPLAKLPQNVDVISYKALTSPKNYVDCQVQYLRLGKLISRVSKAFQFIINPIRSITEFNEPWVQDYSLTIPDQTFDLIKYAYHNSAKPISIKTPGSYSKIYKLTVNHRSINNHYIIKCFKPTNDPRTKLAIQREINLLMLLKHPNILPCLAIDNYGLFFQEGVPFMKHLSNHPVSPTLLKKYFLQIANALNYLHEKGFTHKDVKLDNFIILNGNAYLIDLGFTRLTNNDQNHAGTPIYMAPEIQNRSKPYSNKVDSWSFGIALLQVLSNKPISLLKDNSIASQKNFIETHLNKPFAIDYFEKIKNPNQIEALKNRDPEGHFQKIILECLHGDANKRLSMQEIINKLEPIY